jgi:hypothetical protein
MQSLWRTISPWNEAAMNPNSRRGFLKTTGLGLAALSALDLSREAGQGEEAVPDEPPIPPHRALAVPGVHVYPREHSVAAGETLELCTSASVPYQLSIHRLGHTLDDSSGDELLTRFPEEPPRPHPIHPGSYVHVASKLDGAITGLALECWVRPWATEAEAGLITQYDEKVACGFGLFLATGGAVGFYLGDGGAYRAAWTAASPVGLLEKGRWSHVAATWDGREKTIWVDGQPVVRQPFEGPAAAGAAPLRLAAAGFDGVAARFLDADLAAPAIYTRALTGAEVVERYQDRGLSRLPPGGAGAETAAFWPFVEEQGDRVADASGQGRHGRIINHATWMIGGPSFGGDVSRFAAYDPTNDRTRGHGLRFASDDLYDCRWPVAHRWAVPSDTKPGLYVARCHFTYDGTERVGETMFVVRRAASRPPAPILVLAATNTWRAYSGTPFVIPPVEAMPIFGTGGLGKGEPGVPAFDLYRAHAAGQGTYQVGLRMPWPAAGPYVLYGGPTRYSHLARADRFAHVWLEQNGYDFDLISDLDLHRNPGVLKDYKVVVINGHNEYWSLPMYRGLEDYLRGGGRLVVLSGNTLFWRVSFNATGTVMEARKVDAAGFQVPRGRRGEAWHSHDGRRGGMLRECGYPGWRLIGLDSLGYNSPGIAENFGPFVAERTDHPFFRTPEETGLNPGDRFGWAGEGRVPMANGHEFDVRPSILVAMQEQPSPEGGVVPPDPPGIVRLANGIIPWSKGGTAFDYFFRPFKPKTEQGGEMIDWPRPEGGRVFNAGTIGAGWALAADPRWSTLLKNVLHHFGVTRRM